MGKSEKKEPSKSSKAVQCKKKIKANVTKLKDLKSERKEVKEELKSIKQQLKSVKGVKGSEAEEEDLRQQKLDLQRKNQI
eukprot:TRINITY_DN879_c0_g1_i1.p2 TRINITY_DN879_c0_g1~~TRINITY_DN879_c0_g1_i1.p2  ORF type:complete len:93 (+),score=34.62 TRINITY_DN879_c0_g1_i1:41-280(+)